MDPLTHAALGATIGHAGFHRQLGARAVACGAVMAMVPDLDLLYGAVQGPFDRLVSHRGLTHSLMFAPVVGTIAGWAYWRWNEQRQQGLGQVTAGPLLWIALFIFALLSHPLLDWCTTYGTQLLMPFSRDRFALNAIAIVDPAYSLMLVAGLVGGRLARDGLRAGWYSGAALILTTLYLAAGLRLNGLAEAEATYQLETAGVEVTEAHAFPTILQLPHRRLIVLSPSEIRIGFISMWRPCPVEWTTVPELDGDYIRTLRDTREGRIYEWFASDLIVARVAADHDPVQVDLLDLRYGYEPDTLIGMWGVRGFFGSDGRLVEPPQRFNDRPEPSLANIAGLWADAFPKTCNKPTDAGF
jgi:inner membrane protein